MYFQRLAAISAALLLTPCSAKAETISMVCKGYERFLKTNRIVPLEMTATLDLEAREFATSYGNFAVTRFDSRTVDLSFQGPHGRVADGSLNRVSGVIFIFTTALHDKRSDTTVITANCLPVTKML
jgi:hypothetical protein